jgi:hypothetical protein
MKSIRTPFERLTFGAGGNRVGTVIKMAFYSSYNARYLIHRFRTKAPLINKVINLNLPVDMMPPYEAGGAAAAAEAHGGVAAVG